MYYFCTYFDQYYLPRGLALYRSLQEHCTEFRLWILCMDDTVYRILTELKLPGMYPITLEEFERNDESLKIAKTNRSKIEYYFTCTPSLPLYVLNHWSDVDLITYLDADLFFFADPAPLFTEFGKGSVAIIGHRFTPRLRCLEQYGIYNVGWLSFRRDEHALACLNWWREQCVTWCYDREEDGRFADQRYMDEWPSRFKGVVVLQHEGANISSWNIENYKLSYKRKHVFVNNEPLIFVHLCGLKMIRKWLYFLAWPARDFYSLFILRSIIVIPYLAQLFEIADTYLHDSHVIRSNRNRAEIVCLNNDLWSMFFAKLKMLLGFFRHLIRGRYYFLAFGKFH